MTNSSETTSDLSSISNGTSSTNDSSKDSASSSKPSTSSETSSKKPQNSTSSVHSVPEYPTDNPSRPSVQVPTAWTEMPYNTNKNLKYFGYFHSDGFGAQKSYIAEIAELGNANIVMINSAWNATEAVNDLSVAKIHNMKAIVSVHGLLTSGQVGVMDSRSLISNWQSQWKTYQSAVQQFIDDGTIYAFYFDEPRWNGVSKADFHKLTKYIREQTGVGVMACMTAMDMGWSSYGGIGPCDDDYLKYCTDVMFDDYGDWDSAKRLNYLQALKDKSPKNAWIWGCPKGFDSSSGNDGIKRMEDHIKGQYAEAVFDERYIGIISFSYANGITEGDWGYGLHDFFSINGECYNSMFRDLYLQIGHAIIANNK